MYLPTPLSLVVQTTHVPFYTLGKWKWSKTDRKCIEKCIEKNSKFVILESEVLEAHAQYDFTARSSREVSFKKGDTILLYAQVKQGVARWGGYKLQEGGHHPTQRAGKKRV